MEIQPNSSLANCWSWSALKDDHQLWNCYTDGHIDLTQCLWAGLINLLFFQKVLCEWRTSQLFCIFHFWERMQLQHQWHQPKQYKKGLAAAAGFTFNSFSEAMYYCQSMAVTSILDGIYDHESPQPNATAAFRSFHLHFVCSLKVLKANETIFKKFFSNFFPRAVQGGSL